MLTGEAGCGKSTACRAVTERLHAGLYKVCYVSLSTGSVLDRYNVIAESFGLERFYQRSAAYLAIRDAVTRMVTESHQIPILIFDEAQYLQNACLIELQLLTNDRMDTENPLCVLLVGQTSLNSRLRLTVLQSLSQRLLLRAHLSGLTADEVPGYLRHRMRLAGTELDLFEPPAVEALTLASQGLPRTLDRLAHYALQAAASQQERIVTPVHVEVAVAEFGH